MWSKETPVALYAIELFTHFVWYAFYHQRNAAEMCRASLKKAIRVLLSVDCRRIAMLYVSLGTLEEHEADDSWTVRQGTVDIHNVYN